MDVTSKLPDDMRREVLGEGVVDDPRDWAKLDKFFTRIPNFLTESDSGRRKMILRLEKCVDKKWGKSRLVNHHLKRLTFEQRRKLGLYSIGRKSLKYEEMLPLHELWEGYIKSFINFKNIAVNRLFGDNADHGYSEQIGMKLYRADYHGAELHVNRSSCPNYVGLGGIVAMETKNCFMLVGKDDITRRIAKAKCQFTFNIDDTKFSFNGKNFIGRPAERSSKKIKTIHPLCSL